MRVSHGLSKVWVIGDPGRNSFSGGVGMKCLIKGIARDSRRRRVGDRERLEFCCRG